MAFCKLSDYEGDIDCTFFSNVWEKLRGRFKDGDIVAFKGKVDGMRETPSFLVDSIEDAKALENHSKSSIHIQLDSDYKSTQEILPLRDFLFDNSGDCSVYFHMSVNKQPYVIKGNSQLHVAYSDSVIKTIKDLPCVKEVWAE